MPKLPIISGVKAVKALAIIGYAFDHQTGSHMILRQDIAPHKHLTIPKHKELSKGLLRAIIKQAGLTREEFFALLKKI